MLALSHQFECVSSKITFITKECLFRSGVLLWYYFGIMIHFIWLTHAFQSYCYLNEYHMVRIDPSRTAVKKAEKSIVFTTIWYGIFLLRWINWQHRESSSDWPLLNINKNFANISPKQLYRSVSVYCVHVAHSGSWKSNPPPWFHRFFINCMLIII